MQRFVTVFSAYLYEYILDYNMTLSDKTSILDKGTQYVNHLAHNSGLLSTAHQSLFLSLQGWFFILQSSWPLIYSTGPAKYNIFGP